MGAARGPAPSRGRAAGGGLTVLPNAMQGKALAQIDLIRARGERRAIVVSATGTGKTILSALDVRAVAPRRLLFVVHREQILDKAITEFQRVLDEPEGSFGKVAGGVREWDRRYVFATVQSLNSAGVLEAIHPETFDYVLIDEVHRAGTGSYRRLLDHLRPGFPAGHDGHPRADRRSQHLRTVRLQPRLRDPAAAGAGVGHARALPLLRRHRPCGSRR